jgi:hypothetical protein
MTVAFSINIWCLVKPNYLLCDLAAEKLAKGRQ